MKKIGEISVLIKRIDLISNESDYMATYCYEFDKKFSFDVLPNHIYLN